MSLSRSRGVYRTWNRYRKSSIRVAELCSHICSDLTSATELPESDIIVYLASHSQVQPIADDPQLALENLEMTQQVLTEVELMNAFVVNASSRDVYGSTVQPRESEVTADSPNGYAASKIGSEALANAYYHMREMPVASLQLANVYGSCDRNQRGISIFIALANAGEELTVYGEGKILDFVHVQDVCDAILATIQRADTRQERCLILAIASEIRFWMSHPRLPRPSTTVRGGQ